MSRKPPCGFLRVQSNESILMRPFSLLIFPAALGLIFARPVLADQISEAKDICAFFEKNGLQGECKLDPLNTKIELALTGFYDNPPECSKIADMLRSFRMEPGRDWQLLIHARIKDEPTDIECGLGNRSSQ